MTTKKETTKKPAGIRFDAEPALGYWEQRGYDVNAWVGRSNGV